MGDSLYKTCPLDPSHVIQIHKMQTHLVKCKKNHDMTKKSICPYNCTHIVDTIVFEHHVENCPDSRSVQQFTYSTDHKPLRGILPVEEIVKRQAEQMANNPYEEESWDVPQQGRPGYDPKKYIEGKNIIRQISVAPKSQRKAFRQAEIKRHQDLENSTIVPASRRYLGVTNQNSQVSLASSTTSLSSAQTLGKLRLPRTESHTMSMDNLSLGKIRKDLLASQNDLKQKEEQKKAALDKWINAAAEKIDDPNNQLNKPIQNQYAKSTAALNEMSDDMAKMSIKNRASYDKNFPQGLGKRLAPTFGNNLKNRDTEQLPRSPSIGRGISMKSLIRQPGGSSISIPTLN